MKTKLINGRQMRVTEDETRGIYPFGRKWVIKDLTNGRTIHLAKSFREVEKFLGIAEEN